MPTYNSSPVSLGSVDDILASIAAERQRLQNSEEDARENIIDQARKLITALQTPLESILWVIWAEPSRTFASRFALELQLFQTLVSDGGRPKSAAELAAPTGASPLLVNRIARMLSTSCMLEETGPGEYAPNDLTRILTIPKYSEGIRFCYDSAGPSFVRMTEYLENKGFQNPEDSYDGPFQYAQSAPNVFAWINERPKILQAFHAYVHGQREDRPIWTDEGFYPVKERLVDGLDLEGDHSALVDVGGGAGYVLTEFHARVPEWKGRLILQEQESVIDHAKTMVLDERIELQVHDFFQEQPVKGARAYYMRYVLHDWSDEICQLILNRLKDAMTPGYSKILINECAIADKGAAWQHVSLDLCMMALTSGYERTEAEWHHIIESVGLKVAGIWNKGKGNESLIEVVL